MNVVTFLLKGNKRSKSAITAAIFLLGLTAMWGINKGYQKLTHMEEIQVAPDEAVSTNSSIKKQSNQSEAVFMAPCDEDFDCLGRVNLSVGQNCEAFIGPDMLFVNPTGLPQDTFTYVIMEPNGSIRDTNLFTSADLGKKFKVSVAIKGCDNAPCWTDVLIEDKLKPVLVCPTDVTIACSMDTDDVAPPRATDNCTVTVSKVTSAYFPYPCSNPQSADYLGYYIIKWRAVDGYNMDTTCDQTVNVVRTDYTDIVWPSPSVELECQNVIGAVTPAQGGIPTLNGAPLYPIMDACMAQLEFKDTLLSGVNSCTRIIRRDWELIQWTCGAPIIDTYTQLIRIVDTQAPTIAAIPDMTVFMTSGECEQNIKLPLAVASDRCQKTLKYEVIYPGGIANTNGPTIQLGVGVFDVIYNISDLPCGNTSTERFAITVVDKVAPIAICQPVNVVALNNQGEGFLTAEQVGKHSYDYCGDPVTIEIRRMELGCENDTAWTDIVHYCCEDVGRALMVGIKVTDSNGNENFCMTEVIVQNKIVPDATFPEDTTVGCSFVIDYRRLDSIFGRPMIIGTECQNAGIFRDTVIRDLSDCGIGEIERRWQLIFNGQVVETGNQIITVVPDSIFNPDSIIWPQMEVTTSIDSTDEIYTGSPFIPFVPCNMVGLNRSEDTLFFNNSGTCFKILRTWKVINWCGEDPTEVIAQFTQTIIVQDKVAPVITSPTTLVTACSFAATCAASNVLVILKASATDNNTLKQDLVWTYDIDLFKNGSIDASGFGDSIQYLAPAGLHKITFTVYDGCGSSAMTMYDFEVKNCKEPSPKCIGIVTKLMEPMVPGGPLMVEICAKDFDAGSDDVCTPADSLRFTFNMAYPVDSLINQTHYFKGNGLLATEAEYLLGNAQRWDPANRTSCIILDCDNAPIALLDVTVWDLDKNKGICQVTVNLQGGPCCQDKIAPIITTSDSTRRVLNTTPNCAAPMKVTFTATATDAVPANLLKWTYSLDVGKDGTIDSTGMSNTFMANLPVDTHKVTFIVADTCNNKDTLMYDIIIFNDKGPKANCRTTNLEVALVDPDGAGPMTLMAVVNAKDLDNLSNLSADSCSTDPLIYTFNGAYPVDSLIGQIHYFTGNGVRSDSLTFVAGNAQQWVPATKTSRLKFDCGDQGLRSVTFTVWDPSRKSSSCTATVNISGPCPCLDIVRPTISTSDSIRNFCINTQTCDSLAVTLGATATDPGTPAARLTWIWRLDYGNNGSTEATGMATGGSVSISPKAPVGMNKVTFIVSDTCANKDTVEYIFKIKNCLPPICVTRPITLSPIDPDGDGPMLAMIEIGADTINNGSSDACTPANQLTFTFSGAFPKKDSLAFMHFFKGNGLSATLTEFNNGSAQKWIPAKRASRIKLTCGTAPSVLTMTVFDTDSLSSSCNATITLNCPRDLCAENPFTGFMAITCQTTPERRNDPLGAIYNVKQNGSAPNMTNWSLTPFIPANWRLDSIGQIFGIATDDSANVYLASSDVYLYPSAQPVGIPTGRIYKASPPLFRAVPLVSLANFGGDFNGIGNVVVDRKNKSIFATNLEDGKIYRINPTTGAIISSYDPFIADNGTSGIAPQAEQIWGIGINYEADSVKLYFPRISGATRQMWSLKLTAAGAFPVAGSERLEINGLPGDEVRITDIAFSDNGRSMLWAERGGNAKVSPSVAITQGSHTAIVAKYNLTSSWTFDKLLKIGSNVETEFQAGASGVSGITFGENSAGGVDFGHRQVGLDTFAVRDGLMWASGNWLHKGTAYTVASRDSLYYGVQGIHFDSIGNVRKDIVIDFNNDGTSFIDKGLIGDIEMFRCRKDTTRAGIVAGVDGEIFTQKDIVVEAVTVEVEGTNILKATTDKVGKYGVSDLNTGQAYSVKPIKDDDHKNGVNVIDLLHVQRHILGIKRLDNPYYMIAADVDKDEKVTISDLVSLRKMILGVTERFEGNTSWRFIDKSFQFQDAVNPWANPLPESYYINSLNSDMKVDFRGIKIGDVDGSVIANSSQAKGRSQGISKLTMDDQEVQTSGHVEIPIFGDITSLEALQVNLIAKGIMVEDILPGTLPIDLSNAYVDQNNILHFVHIEAKGKYLDQNMPLFTIVAKVLKDGYLKDMVYLDQQSIAYDDSFGENELALEVRNSEQNAKMIVHQNYPNPWSNNTIIAYELPQSGTVTIRINDLAGRELYRRSFEGQRGRNETTIDQTILHQDGIYIYNLSYEQEVVNKKMIFIMK